MSSSKDDYFAVLVDQQPTTKASGTTKNGTGDGSDTRPSPNVSTGKDEKKSSKKDGDEEERGQWDNQVQFLLSCIGLAVGLGNIWRFPALAYDNGGSAFLIPYITCSLLFGLPMVYAEFFIGQYSRSGPAKAFRKFAPAFEGLGWSMATLSISVVVYYTVIIAWSAMYLVFIIIGRYSDITSCGLLKDKNCIDSMESTMCAAQTDNNKSIALGGYCYSTDALLTYGHDNATTAAELFFKNWLTTRSTGMWDIEAVNWPVAGALLVLWVFVFGTLIKGIKLMGYLSYVTSTVPYVVIVILLIRGVTLDHAWDGIKVYLFEPDFNKILNAKTWSLALNQLLFSLNVGYGGLVALSSYSRYGNNCFRDALIVIAGDTSMSVIGGIAVYSVLGYLSHSTGRNVNEIVSSGTSLAFITYPEAIAKMPAPFVWAFLFFIMLFFLGFSSAIALVETMATSIYDHFPRTRSFKWVVVLCICSTMLLIGLIFTTHAGWYWFKMWSDFAGSTGACVIVILEIILLTWVYGHANIAEDIKEMFGEPKNVISKYFGRHSPYWRFTWSTFCPAFAVFAGIVTCVISPMTEKRPDGTIYEFPTASYAIGWLISLGPLISLPILFYVNYRKLNTGNVGETLKLMFKPTKDLRSYARMYDSEVTSNKEKSAGQKQETLKDTPSDIK